MSKADTPLKVSVKQGRLCIEIGVNTLAHACLASPFAWEMTGDRSDRTDPRDRFTIVIGGFAMDVRGAMLDEREDGSSLLTDLLDKACQKAIEDGSEYFLDNEERS